jgi:hypothetical protein
VEAAPVDVRGFGSTARVVPDAGGRGAVTAPLIVPWRLRNALVPGVEVVFAVFDDCTGYIFGRADGEDA